MRPIKFRAWSHGVKSDSAVTRRKYGDWVFPPQMLYDEKPGDCLVWKSQGQNIEVMQYTGLTDRNGKEIYEGDVIQTTTAGDIYQDVVKWSDKDAAWMFESTQGLCTVRWDDIGENPEVIGNAYENPELLEVPNGS